MTDKVQRCNVREIDNKQYFANIVDMKIIDDNRQINIGVYFHICYNATNETQIVSNIKYAINSLNNDFNGTASNLKYGQAFINSLQKTTTNNYVKTMYANCLKLIKPSKIKFVCIGFRFIPILENTFVRQYGDDQNKISSFILTSAPPNDQTRYLNVWVIPMTSLLGFSYFPWMKTVVNGVVINYKTFDRNKLYIDYNLNKTMTHEIGHWLGLLHTFQDYTSKPSSDPVFGIQNASIDYEPSNNQQEFFGDCVSDTPPQKGPTWGNPIIKNYNYASILTKLGNVTYCPMFTNFMDYTNDIDMFMFTEDQIVKMRLFILMYRPRIINEPVNPSFSFARVINNENINNENINIGDVNVISNSPIKLESYDKVKKMYKCYMNSRIEVPIKVDNVYVSFDLLIGNINSYVGYCKDDTFYLAKIETISKNIKRINIKISEEGDIKLIVGTFGNKQQLTFINKITMTTNPVDVVELKTYKNIKELD